MYHLLKQNKTKQNITPSHYSILQNVANLLSRWTLLGKRIKTVTGDSIDIMITQPWLEQLNLSDAEK